MTFTLHSQHSLIATLWFVASMCAGCDQTAPSSNQPPKGSIAPSGSEEHITGTPAPAPAPANNTGLQPCEIICQHAKTLNCSAAPECLSMCAQMRNTMVCGREMDNVMACMAKQTVHHWECTSEGTAILKDDACDSEQGAFATCAIATQQR